MCGKFSDILATEKAISVVYHFNIFNSETLSYYMEKVYLCWKIWVVYFFHILGKTPHIMARFMLANISVLLQLHSM